MTILFGLIIFLRTLYFVFCWDLFVLVIFSFFAHPLQHHLPLLLVMSLSFDFNSSLLIVSVVQMLYKVIWFSSKIKNRRRWWNIETASFTEKEIETETEKGRSSCKESMFNLCICYWICFGHCVMMSWIFPGGWREKWGNKYCWGIQNWQETTYQTSWFGPSWG